MIRCGSPSAISSASPLISFFTEVNSSIPFARSVEISSVRALTGVDNLELDLLSVPFPRVLVFEDGDINLRDILVGVSNDTMSPSSGEMYLFLDVSRIRIASPRFKPSDVSFDRSGRALFDLRGGGVSSSLRSATWTSFAID